jgi:hypothetical protein
MIDAGRRSLSGSAYPRRSEMPWDRILSARHNPNILSHLRALFQRMIGLSMVGHPRWQITVPNLTAPTRPITRPRMHLRHLAGVRAWSYFLRTAMNTMDSPQRSERSGIRYPLHLPVSLKLAQREFHARSENISLGGILLLSAFLIPEGSRVEVAVGVAHLPAPGTQLRTQGKVLRVPPRTTGDFAVAIAFDSPFELGLRGLDSGTRLPEESPRPSQKRDSGVANRWLHLAAAWHMET